MFFENLIKYDAPLCRFGTGARLLPICHSERSEEVPSRRFLNVISTRPKLLFVDQGRHEPAGRSTKPPLPICHFDQANAVSAWRNLPYFYSKPHQRPRRFLDFGSLTLASARNDRKDKAKQRRSTNNKTSGGGFLDFGSLTLASARNDSWEVVTGRNDRIRMREYNASPRRKGAGSRLNRLIFAAYMNATPLVRQFQRASRSSTFTSSAPYTSLRYLMP